MFDWIQPNDSLIMWLFIGSGISFVLTLILVPAVIILLPVDYFSYQKKQRTFWSDSHPLIKLPLILVKNLVGLALFVAGALMLALPGQGLITMLAGLVLIDFPRKYQLERWAVSRDVVLRSINWVRRKAGKEEFVM